MKAEGFLRTAILDPAAFSLLIDPFADQRGFAKAGGGRDEGQLAASP